LSSDVAMARRVLSFGSLVAAAEGRLEELGLEATVFWTEFSGYSGTGIGAGGMAGVLVGDETRGGGVTESFRAEGNGRVLTCSQMICHRRRELGMEKCWNSGQRCC